MFLGTPIITSVRSLGNCQPVACANCRRYEMAAATFSRFLAEKYADDERLRSRFYEAFQLPCEVHYCPVDLDSTDVVSPSQELLDVCPSRSSDEQTERSVDQSASEPAPAGKAPTLREVLRRRVARKSKSLADGSSACASLELGAAPAHNSGVTAGAIASIKERLIDSIVESKSVAQQFKATNARDCVQSIRLLDTTLRHGQKKLLVLYAELGRVVTTLKRLTGRRYTEILKTNGIQYSKQHISFLCKLYRLGARHPRLLQTGLSLHFLQRNFRAIELALRELAW